MEDYEYSVGIEWWVFLATGSVTMLIAVSTVAFQSIRAALTNPARTLKSE